MRIQPNKKRSLATKLLMVVFILGSFTPLLSEQAIAGECGCEAAVCGCDDVSCGFEEPACGCEEPSCGMEGPLSRIFKSRCKQEAACGCEQPACGCETISSDCGECSGGFGIFENLRRRKANCGLEAACGCEQPVCGCEEPSCGMLPTCEMEVDCGCEMPVCLCDECQCGETTCGVDEVSCGCDACSSKRSGPMANPLKAAAKKLRNLFKFPKKSRCDATCDDGCDAAMIYELSTPVETTRTHVPPATHHHSQTAPQRRDRGVPVPPPLVIQPKSSAMPHPQPMKRSAPSVQPRMTQPRLVPSESIKDRRPLIDRPSTRSSMPIEVKPAAPQEPMLEPAPKNSGIVPMPIPDRATDAEEEDDADLLFEDMEDPFTDDEVQFRRYQPVRPSSYHTTSTYRANKPRTSSSSRRPKTPAEFSTQRSSSSRRTSQLR